MSDTLKSDSLKKSEDLGKAAMNLNMPMTDIETSICPNCGFMPGVWLSGHPCSECGELLL